MKKLRKLMPLSRRRYTQLIAGSFVMVFLSVMGMGVFGPFAKPTAAAPLLGQFAQATAPTTDPNLDLPTATAGSNTTQTQAGTKCEAAWHNPLAWAICSLAGAMIELINTFDQAISSQLKIDPAQLDENSKAPNAPGPRLYQIWSTFRILSLSLLVIIGLVMVISQALSIGPFDAYSVRKVLPKLLFAIIFITLSWQVLKLLIVLSNDAGLGVRAILYGPFGGEANVSTAILRNGPAQGSIVVIGAVGIAASFSGLGLLSLAFTGLLAIIIGFFVIVLRRVIILMLLILSPIAIACSILPNTKKVWDFWWDAFGKGLLMFPLIMAFIASGRIMASVTESTDINNFTQQIIAFIAYFAPYLLIPATFKLAGGAISTIGGLANDKSRGIFDRQKKYRQRKVAETMAANRAGNRFRGGSETNLRGRLNRGLQRGALMPKAGFDPRKWRGKLSSAIATAGVQGRAEMLEDKDYMAWKGDDDLNRAASESSSEGELRRILSTRYAKRYQGPQGRENLDRDVYHVESMRRKYGNSAFRQATFLQAVAGGTAFGNEEDGADLAEVWKAAGAVAGNDNLVLSDLISKGRSLAMNAGRVDQAGAGFGDTLDIAKKLRDNPNYSIKTANAELGNKVVDAQGAGILLHPSMKQSSVRNLAPVMVERVNAALASGDQRKIDQELGSVAGILDSLNQSNPQKARVIADEVMAHGVLGRGPGGTNTTIAGLVDFARASGSVAFNETRREYNNPAQAQQAAQGQQGPPIPGQPGGNILPGGPGGLGPIGSDRRIKRNIRYLTTTPSNLKLYRFQYLWSNQKYVGVMAQDLLSSHPDAVFINPTSGFYLVDYSKLGLKMLTWEEWQAQQVLVMNNKKRMLSKNT